MYTGHIDNATTYIILSLYLRNLETVIALKNDRKFAEKYSTQLFNKWETQLARTIRYRRTNIIEINNM